MNEVDPVCVIKAKLNNLHDDSFTVVIKPGDWRRMLLRTFDDGVFAGTEETKTVKRCRLANLKTMTTRANNQRR